MMNVLVCERPERLTLARKAIPTRGENEVLIRVRRVGICGDRQALARLYVHFMFPAGIVKRAALVSAVVWWRRASLSPIRRRTG